MALSAENIAQMRRRIAMAPSVPSTLARTLIDEVERMRDELATARVHIEELVPWVVLSTWWAQDENLEEPFDPASARDLQQRLGTMLANSTSVD